MVRSKLDVDGNIHAGRQVQLFELIYSLSGRFDDVDQALVRADFKLLHRFLVYVRRAIHREFLDLDM